MCPTAQVILKPTLKERTLQDPPPLASPYKTPVTLALVATAGDRSQHSLGFGTSGQHRWALGAAPFPAEGPCMPCSCRPTPARNQGFLGASGFFPAASQHPRRLVGDLESKSVGADVQPQTRRAGGAGAPPPGRAAGEGLGLVANFRAPGRQCVADVPACRPLIPATPKRPPRPLP